MTTENTRLDAAENLVDLKSVEAALVKKFDEFKAESEKANGQFAEYGKVQEETKASLAEITTKTDELHDRLHQIEQKGVKIASNADDGYDVGAEFVKSEQFKDMQAGRSGRARMEVKTAIINATGQNQPLVPADRLGGINTTPNRILTIRDVLPKSNTSSNLVEFVRESSFTNNAGPTVAGSPEAYENVTKPESAMAFTLHTAPVVTLAHWIPASKQVLSDSNDLATHINGRLMYGLKLKEETQLLSGTGANHQINGLITQATSFTQTSPLTTNEIDIIRMAIKQAHVAEYRPNFLVLNPSDWFDIEIRKVGSSDDRYVVGDPSRLMAPNLWGLPVVVTNSISAGTFLIGSSQGAEIKDRQDAMVEVSRENSDNFVKNMVTVLAEERLTLVVYRTEAFITGSL